jgi:hypothetical protein
MIAPSVDQLAVYCAEISSFVGSTILKDCLKDASVE